MSRHVFLCSLPILVLALGVLPLRAQELGQEGYADSGGVKIHYVTLGKGPLVVMLHGFPDYWYTWRDQMPVLAKHHQVVAIDLRGYNKSSQPEGVENYTADKLVGDVEAVIKHFKRDKAVIVGHDWGGFIAWSFAMIRPDQTDRLIVLNLPHPKCLMRELANNPQQQKSSAYARAFQQPDAHKKLSPEFLALWVKEADARKHYIEAFKRSSLEGMLNYYKANYPREPYKDDREFPKVKCPVLMIHGLDDQYLLPGALNDTWKWLDKDLTLVTVPKAGHFVHRDAPKLVNEAMSRWLGHANVSAVFPTAEVSGTVTYDGKPLISGTISFLPIDGGEGPVVGGIIKDGKYMLNAPIRKSKVSISVPKVIGKKKLFDKPDSPQVDLIRELIPAKYNELSALIFEVRAGKNICDLELSSK